MQFDVLAHDGQAHPGSALDGGLARNAEEPLEDPGVMGRVDAGTLVADRDDGTPLAALGAHPDDTRGLGVLGGVADQIDENPFQGLRVGPDNQVRRNVHLDNAARQRRLQLFQDPGDPIGRGSIATRPASNRE